ncbi:MAG: site-specific tyrosine recombinase XerD [Bacteroidota bacterium]
MNWEILIKGFAAYLMLERSLSANSIEAYIRDVGKFEDYYHLRGFGLKPKEIELHHVQGFIHWINELGLEATSQARIISGLKAFFKYLLIEDIIDEDPSELLEGPKLDRKIPSVLTYEEISALMGALQFERNDMLRIRNLAILETLYACGLRVSELVNLKLSNLFLDVGFIKIIGKGDKERLVPIGQSAREAIKDYLYQPNGRWTVKAQVGHEDFLFLNRRGKQLTRVMIFTIIKRLAGMAGIKKKVSPHTFRHSFATHLIEGGADLKAIQDMLGHESITTTEIYTHLDTDFLRDTILNFHPSNKK